MRYPKRPSGNGCTFQCPNLTALEPDRAESVWSRPSAGSCPSQTPQDNCRTGPWQLRICSNAAPSRLSVSGRERLRLWLYHFKGLYHSDFPEHRLIMYFQMNANRWSVRKYSNSAAHCVDQFLSFIDNGYRVVLASPQACCTKTNTKAATEIGASDKTW